MVSLVGDHKIGPAVRMAAAHPTTRSPRRKRIRKRRGCEKGCSSFESHYRVRWRMSTLRGISARSRRPNFPFRWIVHSQSLRFAQHRKGTRVPRANGNGTQTRDPRQSVPEPARQCLCGRRPFRERSAGPGSHGRKKALRRRFTRLPLEGVETACRFRPCQPPSHREHFFAGT